MDKEIKMKALKGELSEKEWQALICIPTGQAVIEFWPLVKDEKRSDGVTPALLTPQSLRDLLINSFHKKNIGGDQDTPKKVLRGLGKGGAIWLNRQDTLDFLVLWCKKAKKSNGSVHYDWGRKQRDEELLAQKTQEQPKPAQEKVPPTEAKPLQEACPVTKKFPKSKPLKEKSSLIAKLFTLMPWRKKESKQTEQPKAKQPKAEQPKAEQPKAEQPKSEYVVRNANEIIVIVSGAGKIKAKAEAFDEMGFRLDILTDSERKILEFNKKN